MAKTKPDFTIKPGAVIWRHNRAFKAGNEAELEAAGFPVDQKRRKAATGQIEWAEPAKTAKSETKKTPTKEGDKAPKDDAGDSAEQK